MKLEEKLKKIEADNLLLNIRQNTLPEVIEAIRMIWASLSKKQPVVILADGPRELARMACVCYLVSRGMESQNFKLGTKSISFTYKESMESQLRKLKLSDDKFWQLYSGLYTGLFVNLLPKMKSQLDNKKQKSDYLEDNTRKIWNTFLPEEPKFPEFAVDEAFDKQIEALIKEIRSKFASNIAINNCIPTRTWVNHFQLKEAKKEEVDTEKLRLYEQVAWKVPLVASYDEIAIVSQNMTFVGYENQQIHCTTGPAIDFPDGYRVYSINGITVDEQIVMRPETQTVKQIEQEQNADIKSIRAERFGYARLVKEGGYEAVDERENEIEGTIEALYKTPNNFNCLLATCPSGKLAAMPVPPTILKCVDAAKWLNPVTRFGQMVKNPRIIGRT